MNRLSTSLCVLTASLLLAVGFHSSASADIVQPCFTNAVSSSGGNTITMLPIGNGQQTYCQTAFGWSDTWFAKSSPGLYDQHLDVFSGDNAPGVTYTTAAGATVGSGNPQNLISPWVDGGTRNSHFIGSNWTVVNDISVAGNVGTSKITLNGLDLVITTTLVGNGVTEQFAFTNNTGNVIAHLRFSDYFNFHPNGSLVGDIPCATTSFNVVTGTVTTTGKAGCGGGEIVSQGTMKGSSLPTTWDLGLASDVLSDMANGIFNEATGPFVGDGAVDLAWDLGGLGLGASIVFLINKNFEIPPPPPRFDTPLPVPSTLSLFGIGLVGLLAVSRRRRAVSPSPLRDVAVR